MKQTPVTAVLFDWDLTLARALGDATYSQRLTALFAHVGLTFLESEVANAVQQVQNQVDPNDHRKTHPQTRRDIINHYFRILKQLGFRERSWAFGNRMYDAYADLPTSLYDDARPLLQQLQARDIKMGVISNHATTARPLIEKHLADFISPKNIVISQEIGVHKPARGIFAFSLRKMKLSSENVVFVGNSLPVDAIAAVEQGGFQLGLWLDREDDGRPSSLPLRVHRITGLEQVLDYL